MTKGILLNAETNLPRKGPRKGSDISPAQQNSGRLIHYYLVIEVVKININKYQSKMERAGPSFWTSPDGWSKGIGSVRAAPRVDFLLIGDFKVRVDWCRAACGVHHHRPCR